MATYRADMHRAWDRINSVPRSDPRVGGADATAVGRAMVHALHELGLSGTAAGRQGSLVQSIETVALRGDRSWVP
jgi:hypothetical protein